MLQNVQYSNESGLIKSTAFPDIMVKWVLFLGFYYTYAIHIYTVSQCKVVTHVNNCVKLKLMLMSINVQYVLVNLEGVHKNWLKIMNRM